jgi:hypothetical protein
LVNSVNTVHIRTFELDKADAETIFEHLKSGVAEFGLKLQNFLMLSSDGPNVNKKNHEFDENSRQRGTWLRTLGRGIL